MCFFGALNIRVFGDRSSLQLCAETRPLQPPGDAEQAINVGALRTTYTVVGVPYYNNSTRYPETI